MSDLKFEIDVNEIVKGFGDLKDNLSKDIIQATQDVANMTHAKVLELATNNLNSLSKKYTDAVSFSNPDENLWVVTLDSSAMWIESGRKSGEMISDLLRTGAKIGKDGKKYKAIPFNHSKPPSQQSSAAKDMSAFVKGEMKKRDINFKKIEYGKDGSPRTGLLHRFNVDNPRMSEAQTKNLKGIAVYQTKQKDGTVRRDTMSFRIVSEKQMGQGKWNHPGMPAKNFMDQALDWAMETFDTEMLPAILKKYE